jgi:hypothetical protein
VLFTVVVIENRESASALRIWRVSPYLVEKREIEGARLTAGDWKNIESVIIEC